MELECSKITRFILPAVRASVAEEMTNKYEYNQQEIADVLGVAQVAVSKYLSGKYSKSVGKIKRYISSNNLEAGVVKFARKSNAVRVNKEIQDLCARIATTNLVI